MRIQIPGSLVFLALVAATVVVCLQVESSEEPQSASESTAYHVLLGHSKGCWACTLIDRGKDPMSPEQAAEIAKATQAHADVSTGVGYPRRRAIGGSRLGASESVSRNLFSSEKTGF